MIHMMILSNLKWHSNQQKPKLPGRIKAHEIIIKSRSFCRAHDWACDSTPAVFLQILLSVQTHAPNKENKNSEAFINAVFTLSSKAFTIMTYHNTHKTVQRFKKCMMGRLLLNDLEMRNCCSHSVKQLPDSWYHFPIRSSISAAASLLMSSKKRVRLIMIKKK